MNLINIAAALALASTVWGAVIPQGAFVSTVGSLSKVEHTVTSFPGTTVNKIDGTIFDNNSADMDTDAIAAAEATADEATKGP